MLKFKYYEIKRYIDSMDKSIAVFTATHVKSDPPSIPIYIPLHEGKYGKI